MPSKISKLNKLYDVESKLHNLYVAKASGEEFHPDYKKHPKLFNKLVRSDLALERELGKYFNSLAKQRLKDYINWRQYDVDILHASITDWVTADWSPERLLLKVILTKTLTDALEAGGELTELDTKIDIGWTAQMPTASEFMRKYTLKLAGALTDVTIDRVKNSLATSFDLGEGQAEAVKRLLDVIDDPRRAATIAHTEAVRAFAGGRLGVAAEIGADRKRWDATVGACEICAPMDGEVVGLDESFSSGDDAPPAHPNCRCLVNILMPEEGMQAEPWDDPFDAVKNLFSNL